MTQLRNICIFGFPRSGSTMFYNMLRSSVRDYNFTNRELSAVHAFRDKPWPIITKFPSDCFYRDEIRDIDPDVLFMAMIRDPRDVLCSKHQTTGEEYKVSWDRTIFGKPSPNRFKAQMRPGRYRSHWGLIDWYAQIKASGALRIMYEPLVINPGGIQLILHKHLGLNFHADMSDFYRTEIPPGLSKQLNGVRPLDPSRIGAWRDHPDRIKEQFGACEELFDVLIELGYEKDREWIKTL